MSVEVTMLCLACALGEWMGTWITWPAEFDLIYP